MAEPDFLNRGIEEAKKAVTADRAGEREEACQLYSAAVDLFFIAKRSKRYAKNPRAQAVIVSKIKEYLTRAEYLREQLKDESDKKNAAACGANGKASTKGNGESASERKKLEEALEDTIVRETPNVKWDDVVGLRKAKTTLKNSTITPNRLPRWFQGERKPWAGVLLYGPPGTGKSFLAKAVATEAKGTFFSVSSSDLVSKWMGESERLVKALFNMARDKKPSVIFIDEIDALCGPRGEGESEASRRIKTELLVQMDGVKYDMRGVIVLGATNIPWQLDSAIRRRFQQRIHIDLPDEEARVTMFEKAVGETRSSITEEQYRNLAEQTEGYSGSDISAVVRKALMQPVDELDETYHYKKVEQDGEIMFLGCSPGDPDAIEMFWTDIDPDKMAVPDITWGQCNKAIESQRPTVGKEDLSRNEKWTEEFGSKGA